jgi:CRISPR-associated protein Cmr6
MSLAYREIRDKISLQQEANLFSVSLLASVEYNLEKVKGLKHTELRREILEWLVKASTKQAKELCEKAKKRLQKIAEAYRLVGYKLISSEGKFIEARLTSRALFGSRSFNYTLFEVGLEFDPYLNLPVVPGSSIKGALNTAWEVLELGDGKDVIFGRKREVGRCVFCDALPIEPNQDGFILYPDVVTPHYPDDEIEETKEPNPITYISVAPGVKFGFLITVDKTVSFDILEKLRRAFLFALWVGLGARTSVGYGVFEVTHFNIQLG